MDNKSYKYPTTDSTTTHWSTNCKFRQGGSTIARTHWHSGATAYIRWVPRFAHNDGPRFEMACSLSYWRHHRQTGHTKFYNGWVARFGCPTIITTDQGRQFESELFNKFNKGIRRNNCLPPASKRHDRTLAPHTKNRTDCKIYFYKLVTRTTCSAIGTSRKYQRRHWQKCDGVVIRTSATITRPILRREMQI